MSNLYNEFENKFQFSYFSAEWNDVEIETTPEMHKQIDELFEKKDLQTLEHELDAIKENIENISQKQLRLANLAKFYQ